MFSASRSSVREFLASEAMHHLGVSTTRALSLIVSEEETVMRPWYSPAAERQVLFLQTTPFPSTATALKPHEPNKKKKRKKKERKKN